MKKLLLVLLLVPLINCSKDDDLQFDPLYSNPEQGQPRDDYVHFEMLLVKRNGWKLLMEYQKGPATEEEWDAAE